MSTILITYRLRAEHVDEHLALLATVHDELSRRRLEEVGWTTYRRKDGRGFVELVQTDRPGRFSSLDSWTAFRSALEQRCDQLPEVFDLELVARSPARQA